MPARRRFYLFDKILTNEAAAYEWVDDRACVERGSLLGRHHHVIEGWDRPIWVGLPVFTGTPKLRLFPRRRLLDFLGYGPYFVSARAKALFERIDAEAFEFEACETVDARGRPIETYWLMAVARLVQRFDEERSEFVSYAERFPDAPEAATNPAISQLGDIHMPEGFPDDWHAFILARYQTQFIASGDIVDAWEAEKLTGARFTPLQPPTGREMRRHLSFYNYPYWSAKAGRWPPPMPERVDAPAWPSRPELEPVSATEKARWGLFAAGVVGLFLYGAFGPGVGNSWRSFIVFMAATTLIAYRHPFAAFVERLLAERRRRR